MSAMTPWKIGARVIRRVTVPSLFPPPTYSHASVVEAGTRLAFLAGSVPLDAEGKLVGEGDPVRQAERVLANLEEQLRAVGSDLAHVVSTDVYVVADDPAVLSAVWDVVEASGLSTGPHSSTLLGVACLGYTGQLVEITATAVVPDPSAAAS
ncbi:enamine deaminase RidA (YjgF/YER057c/UK114 family) [Streptomyces griseostramineus]|uniref:Enamine deaminase RidA (YjgF/YER057c/UK114 family) n=1 Tax=Streptomyces griseomycini TaxID=66895 RepID=A0A7W7LTS0_9ACTN|nr:enamine deaminase RidA (YjgF/YER057c/UK114 family) [Streptomyces griseomycini]